MSLKCWKWAQPWASIPCSSQREGLPRWKMGLLIAFVFPKVPHSDDSTWTLRRQVSEQNAYASQPYRAQQARRRASVQPPDGSCRHQMELSKVKAPHFRSYLYSKPSKSWPLPRIPENSTAFPTRISLITHKKGLANLQIRIVLKGCLVLL